MQGSLREEDVPWWFTGVIFAVTGERETPRPLVRFEGMEIYWFQHLADGFQLGGHTVTFFRDFETHEYLREFRNPWTRRVDEVKPAVQGGNLGFRYSTDGIWPVRLDGTAIGEPRRAPLWVQWHGVNDGDMDVYLPLADQANRLIMSRLKEQGALVYEDVTLKSGAGDMRGARGCAVAAFDNDGFVDIYVNNGGPSNTLINDVITDFPPFVQFYIAWEPAGNALLCNNGDGSFTDVTR